jgi:hypothetical protein
LKRDHEARVDEARRLVRCVQAFEQANRKVPGHVLTQLVRFKDVWKDLDHVPACAHEAARVLANRSVDIS